MDSGYRTIFWGIFFSTFHFNLGPIQILPVFVAWIIVASGINKLNAAAENKHFNSAYSFAGFAIVFSLFTGVLSFVWAGAANSILLTVASPVAFGILELISEAKILTGSIQCFENSNQTELACEYTKKVKYYILFFLAFLLLECITLSLFINGFVIAVAVFGIILRLYYMHQMTELKQMYETEPDVEEDNHPGETNNNITDNINLNDDSTNK